MPIRTFRDLEVYQDSYSASLEVSKLTRKFPRIEQPELARQLRRAARSVPANIAEGWAKRSSPAEFKRYLQIAIGSCHEVSIWLDMSKDEGFITEQAHNAMRNRYNKIGVMLYRLWKNWRGTPSPAPSRPPDLPTP
ncbi:MAG: four helix bundle protein [Candidatus Acidiferrales bacterium]